jgi:hypothetical protein
MKSAMAYNAASKQAKQDAMASQAGDEDEIRFIHDQIQKEQAEASVYQRMNELNSVPSTVYSWLPTFLDLCLGLTILYLVYQVFTGKLSAVVSYFRQSSG